MKNVYSFGIIAVMLIIIHVASSLLNAQSPLIPVSDAANPIVNDAGIAAGSYTGCAWVDYDNDGDDDLFWGGNFLYRNDGKGVFTIISTSSLGMAIETDANGFGWAGSSWADYDNDGFVDVFITGRQSFLYHNNGNGTFSRITTGSIGEGKSNVAWACAWADFDNDGDLETSTSPTTAHKLPDWQTRSTAMTAAGALQKSRMLVQLQRTWGFRSVQSGAIWTTTATLIAS
jgi:hypothetical protein